MRLKTVFVSVGLLMCLANTRASADALTQLTQGLDATYAQISVFDDGVIFIGIGHQVYDENGNETDFVVDQPWSVTPQNPSDTTSVIVCGGVKSLDVNGEEAAANANAGARKKDLMIVPVTPTSDTPQSVLDIEGTVTIAPLGDDAIQLTIQTADSSSSFSFCLAITDLEVDSGGYDPANEQQDYLCRAQAADGSYCTVGANCIIGHCGLNSSGKPSCWCILYNIFAKRVSSIPA